MQIFMGNESRCSRDDSSNSPKPEIVGEEHQIQEVEPVAEVASKDSTTTGKRSCLVLEIFSGSCRLSKACRKVGFRVTAIDKETTRAENFPVYQCDLTNSAEVALLHQYIEAEQDELLHVLCTKLRNSVTCP